MKKYRYSPFLEKIKREQREKREAKIITILLIVAMYYFIYCAIKPYF